MRLFLRHILLAPLLLLTGAEGESAASEQPESKPEAKPAAKPAVPASQPSAVTSSLRRRAYPSGR